MSLWKNGKYWYVQYRDEHGRLRNRSSKSVKKSDARELEIEILAKIRSTKNRQERGHFEHIKFYAALDEFESTHKQSGAFKTFITAKNRFKELLPDRNLDDFNSRELFRWVEAERERGISDATIRLWSRQFSKVVNWAKKMGYFIPSYSFPEFHIKEKPIRFLTEDEEQRILDEFDTTELTDSKHITARKSARVLFLVMLESGARVGEASKLKWSDVDFDSGVLHLYHEKTDKEDFIPMTRRLRNALNDHPRINEYVFPSRDGTTHKTAHNNRALYSAFERARVTDITPHIMRKTFGTKLLNNGVDIVTIQHLLSHSSVRTTQKAYAALMTKDKFQNAINTLEEPPKLKLVVTK